MFYANVNSRTFQQSETNTNKLSESALPNLICNTQCELVVKFLNDGSAYTPTGTVELAVGSTYFPATLSAYVTGTAVTGETGVYKFLISCSTVKFKTDTTNGKLIGKLDIQETISGSSEAKSLLMDSVNMWPRVFNSQGTPAAATQEYYTSAQVDALIANLLTIMDTANNFTATTVEGALAEIAGRLDDLEGIADEVGTASASASTASASTASADGGAE